MLNVGIFGNEEFADTFGKKGTANDIVIRNHKSSEGVFVYIRPNSEKIQSLMQALNMIDVPVIVADELTSELGEIMIAIDEMDFQKGFIVAEYPDNVKKMIKGTSMENFEFVSKDELRNKLMELKIDRETDGLEVPIDNHFNVKGIGTVALCIVKCGTIKKHDKVLVEPIGKEVIIKGIQSQDDFIDEAPVGTRVGLSLKGVESDELKRGYVICNKMEKSKEIEIQFKKNRFCSENILPETQIMISVGLQVITFKVVSFDGDVLKLISDHDIVYKKAQKCVVISMNSK